MSITLSFDTLAYAKQLKEADVPEKQAEAQAEALRKALDAALSDQASALTTKADVLRLDAKFDRLEQRSQYRFTLLQWMLGVTLAGEGAILIKLFL